MFRLLYRLFLQRFGQALPTATAKLALPIPQPTRTRWFAALFAVLGLLVIGWHYLELPPPKSLFTLDQAVLHLHISSAETWPVVVYLQGDGLAPLEASFLSVPSGKIESISGSFTPTFQVLPAAGTLEIINSDAIAHNTHIFNRGGTIFNVATPLPGKSIHKTLTGSGIFSVRCDLHPWMQAWLFVPPSRYYAVIHEPNTVSFAELPPGKYVLHLWQADLPEQFRLISLAAGETKTLSLR